MKDDAIRPPTPEEKAQLAEGSTMAEVAMRDALKNWASTIYAIGFAAGVEKALAKKPDAGLFVPSRPPLVVPPGT